MAIDRDPSSEDGYPLSEFEIAFELFVGDDGSLDDSDNGSQPPDPDEREIL